MKTVLFGQVVLGGLLACGTSLAQPVLREPASEKGAQTGPNIIERLRRMTPEERQRWLERLPPERRERIERRLKALEELTPEERDRLQQQYERFRQLPPEQQDAVRNLFRRYSSFPRERREAIREELRQLANLRPIERRDRILSSEFQEKFSIEEQRVIRRLFRLYQAQRDGLNDLP
ncbi:MAG TPA: DUF3106 domain-containing protein [Bryobacteraceae bacterium]|nr:DUF3106 domain-containing protein [Bryobacteraceae bacterium]